MEEAKQKLIDELPTIEKYQGTLGTSAQATTWLPRSRQRAK